MSCPNKCPGNHEVTGCTGCEYQKTGGESDEKKHAVVHVPKGNVLGAKQDRRKGSK